MDVKKFNKLDKVVSKAQHALRYRRSSVPDRKILAPAVAGAALSLGIAGVILARRRTTTRRLGLEPPETVDELDVRRYMGTWYEIAHIPHRLEPQMAGTTATYFLRNDGRIDIMGRSHKKSLDGKVKTVKGMARMSDDAPGKFKVSFMRPFWSDHWIVDVGPNYEWAVVGHPSRDYLWILSREPTLDRAVYENILDRLREQDFPVERLQQTVQPPSDQATVRRKGKGDSARRAGRQATQGSGDRSGVRPSAPN